MDVHDAFFKLLIEVSFLGEFNCHLIFESGVGRWPFSGFEFVKRRDIVDAFELLAGSFVWKSTVIA